MPLVDAYLTGSSAALATHGCGASLFVTQSNGGALTPDAARTRPVSSPCPGQWAASSRAPSSARLTGRPT